MKNISMLLKSVICVATYLFFWLLMFFTAYVNDDILHPFYMAIGFGIICGSVIAIITGCAKLRRTVLSRIIGVISVIATDFLLSMSSIPHKIILYKYRNDAFVQETGRLTVNETLVFGWGNMFFWIAMIISFVVICIGIFVYNAVKNRRMKECSNTNDAGEMI